MKSTWRLAMGLAAVVGMALLVPSAARATTGSGAVRPCTNPTGAYTFTVTITVDASGTPVASPSTNEGGTCVLGGDTIQFDVSSLTPGTTWSATFPKPTAGSLFQNGCTFGNSGTESSSCQVVSNPTSATYSYSVTVNGKTLDPHVIIKGGVGKHHHHHHHRAPKPKPAASTQQ